EAVKWYRKSAEQGNALGQYNLGVMYDYGYGVPKDEAEAVKWYQKSARQGNEDAQKRLKILGKSW
ncbi:tetratricopeptide repeat protein, partial [Capnocytophaga canis]|uniref:tetratricopeptide repeat protein n=1 Tax=Capnocytophaga canis TaxID=1848903 RepID=UPI001562C43C